MRHGEAEIFAQSDETRNLTEYGKQSSFSQGIWLKSQQIEFDKVLVSPYIRAQQTFTEINHAYQQKLIDKTETWQGLTPYGNSENVANYISILLEQGIQNLLIISHLPLVSDIILEFCGRNNVSFLPATLAEIELIGSRGKIIQSKKP